MLDFRPTEDYEQVVSISDSSIGLKVIIAIHSTVLGPALGGTRMFSYLSDDDALKDALRLSKAMSYKASAAGLNLGGGKAVIIGDSLKDKNDSLLRAYGRYINSLGGRYITAADIGTGQKDLNIISKETKYVAGDSGRLDSAPYTAYGVYKGIKASVKEVYGMDSLKGLTIAVQGLGNVGYNLCRNLYEEDAALVITDVDEVALHRASAEFNAKAVPPEEIFDIKCNVFSPCAMGGVINSVTIPRLKCDIVAGGANNVLEELQDGDILYEKGIVYIPDYIINAGGLISVAEQGNGCSKKIMEKTEKIYYRIRDILSQARSEGIAPYKVADMIAYERIQKAKNNRITQ